jgi:NAD(P)-dependent dehydrogenase (short-subunit alcohol dehydrogenase family)
MSRVALVTGGTRGIGEAISIALKNAGITVVANYCGNDARAQAFSDATGIATTKFDVGDFEACKSGIHGFTKALAQEGAAKGITVNAIAPGYVNTDMVHSVPKPVLEKIIARIPVGRLGEAEDIARGVLFLIADEADFITGSTLSINGGQHMY